MAKKDISVAESLAKEYPEFIVIVDGEEHFDMRALMVSKGYINP